MSSRSRCTPLALASLLVLGALLLAAAPAFAAHTYSSSFGSSGSGDGQLALAEVGGLAANEATHDLYVADAGNHRVDEFSASGAFIRAFGADVGGAGVGVCTSGCVAGTSGSKPGALEEPTFIAVDNDPSSPSRGDVYVGDPADSLVSKFDSEGNLISSWASGGQLNGSSGGAFGEIDGIAVNATGHLFVLCGARMVTFEQDGAYISEFNLEYAARNIGIAIDNSSSASSGDIYTRWGSGQETLKFNPSGALLDEVDFVENKALAVDPKNGQLFVAQSNGEVGVYSSSASKLEHFGAAHIEGAAGIAVDGSKQHVVYVANHSTNTIGVFEAGLPEPTTGKATALTETAATLNGHVGLPGGGEITGCYFEWGTTSAYHNKAPCAEGQSFAPPANVHVELTGLYPGTTYHYRLVASSVNGTESGEDETLTTLGAQQKRLYDSQISGFVKSAAVTVDAADHVWVSDLGSKSLISEYSAYPSQNLLTRISAEGRFPCSSPAIRSLAVNSVNDDSYVSEPCGIGIAVLEPSGALVPPPWKNFYQGFPNFLYVAVDNSAESSAGRVYAADTEGIEPYGPFGFGYVQAFTPSHDEVNFEASEPYVTGSKITGTPGGLFQKEGIGLKNIAVDDNGNIYVVEGTKDEVDEFASSGMFVKAFTATDVPGGFDELTGVAIDPTNENVLIVDSGKAVIDELSPSGEYLGQITGENTPAKSFGALSGGIAVNSNGYVYVADPTHGVVDIFSPKSILPKVTYGTPSNPTSHSETLAATIDPRGGGSVTACYFEYGLTTSYGSSPIPCEPATPFISPTEVTASISGLTSEVPYHYRVVVSNAHGTTNGQDHTFVSHWVANLTTGPATNVTNASALLHGSYIGNGADTEYYFEYGTDASYGQSTPTGSNGAGTGSQAVAPVEITGLQPLVTYHYRLVASNVSGTTYGEDQIFTTLTKPTIDSFFSSDLTATSAVLHAVIDPQGADTKYHFEYGPTTAYGESAPTPGPTEDIGSSLAPQSVTEPVANLQVGVTYHFRVIATNAYGTTVSEDQSFGLYPSNCPNAHLRQITNSSRLPDCRAYELVSPANAGGSTLFPEGPNSAEATNPARFAFGGFLSSIPGSGDPPNTQGDLYVATRTDEGWLTKYVGPPASQTFEANGPPDERRSTYSDPLLASPGGVRTDSKMDSFLDWYDGIPWGWATNGGRHGPQSEHGFSPHLWGADGSPLGQWPNVAGYYGSAIFDQSADFTHYVFQTGAPPSLSLIDDDTVTNTATEVSRTAAGEPIPIQPADTDPGQESLRVPAVSRDGSHILMASRAGKLARVTIEQEECRLEQEIESLCPLQPSALYMRIDDVVTYEIAPGHIVDYVGMTPDGSKVYFNSEEQLNGEDNDHSTDLYMWSAEKAEHSEEPITLISKGDNAGIAGEPGNSDSCTPVQGWTAKCGVAPFVNNSYTEPSVAGYLGGNGLSDNSIASANGDIYFFSPEQLAGTRGIRGAENLYDYRHGTVQYVDTFSPAPFCKEEETLSYCSAGPVIRMQVTPTDSHMAFLTADHVTNYDNTGHTEMYTYDPATEEVSCVSCLPSAAPPTSDVYASSNGVFMTNDGRVFFSTTDALVPQDTDGLRDVYEYVEGHAQLISSGTSAKDSTSGIALGANHELFTAGLVGVSADGVNAYFSTYDTLVGQDRNGSQLKFYDARTDGGFPYLAPAASCEAADECHGVGSLSEAAHHNGTGAQLGAGGNVAPKSRVTHHKHKGRHSRKKHKAKSRRHKNTGRSHG